MKTWKRFLVVIATFVMLAAPIAHAEIDLSGMTLAELLELQQRVTMAMWETEEWQEVEVPIGVYEIGVDIPAGHWTISAGVGPYTIDITLGKKLDQTGKGIDWADQIYSTHLANKDSYMNSMFSGQYAESTDLELTEGTYLIVENGSLIFTPYAGKPSLGFK